MLSLQLQVNPPSQASFEKTISLEAINEELLYLYNRMRYYPETATLEQIKNLLDNLDEVESGMVTEDECERQCDEARADAEEEGIEEGKAQISNTIQKILDNHARTLLVGERVSRVKYNELIEELERL